MSCNVSVTFNNLSQGSVKLCLRFTLAALWVTYSTSADIFYSNLDEVVGNRQWDVLFLSASNLVTMNSTPHPPETSLIKGFASLVQYINIWAISSRWTKSRAIYFPNIYSYKNINTYMNQEIIGENDKIT